MSEESTLDDLRVDVLRAALVAITGQIINTSGTLVSFPDYRFVWALCGQITLLTQHPPIGGSNWHLHDLAVATIRAHVSPYPPDLVRDAAALASYLPFPLLEGLLRAGSIEYMASDGRVTKAFSCARQGGSPRTYSIGSQCNNVGDVLQLFVGNIASESLKDDVLKVGESISPGQPFDVACAEISRWRNSSLHGETHTPSGSTVVLQIALLVLLDWVTCDFDVRRSEAVATIAQYNDGTRSPWCFFPIQ